MGEQEVVFIQGPFQHCNNSIPKKVGERQECPLFGHCKVPGWPYALYVVCMCLIKKQQIDLSTVQRMVMKILIGNIDLQTLFPKS